MDNPFKPVLFVLFSLAFLSPVFAADLKTYKDVYQKNSEDIRQTFQPKFTDLQQQYEKSLDALKALSKKQGDLKKTMAAIAEIERFQKAKSLPATLDDNAIAEVKALQSAYVKRYSELETDLTAKLGTLTAKYDQALDRLQKELVQAEKLPDAMEVQQEREKAQSTLKGYAEQMSALTASSATNETSVSVSQQATTPNEKPSAVDGENNSGNGIHAAESKLGKNAVFNGDFSQVVHGKPEGWKSLRGASDSLTLETEGKNKFVRFEKNDVNKDGTVSTLRCISQKIPIPQGAKTVTFSVKLRTTNCIDMPSYAPTLQLEFSNKEGKSAGTSGVPWGGKNGAWDHLKKETRISKDAVTVIVVISTGYRPGQIDFDDVEVIFE